MTSRQAGQNFDFSSEQVQSSSVVCSRDVAAYVSSIRKGIKSSYIYNFIIKRREIERKK